MTDPTLTELVMPSRGVWQASRGGVAIGTVTRARGRYVATRVDGARLGRYRVLAHALDAVDAGRRHWFRIGRGSRAE